MAPHQQRWLSRRVGGLLARLAPRNPLMFRRIVALPVALSLLLFVPVGAYTASQVIAHVASSSGSGAAQLIGRADLHLDNTSIELSVSITQTENACQAPLNGQYCIRYSMAVDEKPVQMGYGLIPNGDVDVKGSSISINVDTSTSRFHHLVGSGGPISVTWTWQPGATPVTVANQTSTLSPATVQGTVLGQSLTGPGLVASVLLYTS